MCSGRLHQFLAFDFQKTAYSSTGILSAQHRKNSQKNMDSFQGLESLTTRQLRRLLSAMCTCCLHYHGKQDGECHGPRERCVVHAVKISPCVFVRTQRYRHNIMTKDLVSVIVPRRPRNRSAGTVKILGASTRYNRIAENNGTIRCTSHIGFPRQGLTMPLMAPAGPWPWYWRGRALYADQSLEYILSQPVLPFTDQEDFSVVRESLRTFESPRQKIKRASNEHSVPKCRQCPDPQGPAKTVTNFLRSKIPTPICWSGDDPSLDLRCPACRPKSDKIV